ncbi:MAG: MBL fold metallo-hydrolase [Clostridia bacterium]|nr:MBL fold metallo-hydrolase [Clostridia bacterium]
MKVKWYGTAMVLIEDAGTKILADPYLMPYAKVETHIPEEDVRDLSGIIITHPHFDHFKDVGTFDGGGKVPVYVSRNGIASAERHGMETTGMVEVKPGDEFTVGNLKLKVYQGRHIRFDLVNIVRVGLSPQTYMHLKREFNILKTHRSFPLAHDTYIYEIQGDGKTALVSGSCATDESVEYPSGVDFMSLAYQGRADLPMQSMKILTKLAPKIVMLSHFDDAYPPVTKGMRTDRFIAAAKKSLPDMTAIIPERNVWYDV